MSLTPSAVERFIFEHVDSIANLELLLLMFADPECPWTAAKAAAELRGNPNSAEQYLRQLTGKLLIKEISSGTYVLERGDSALMDVLKELAAFHKTQRHKVYELIFSPLKKARDFAGAFTRSTKKEDGDG